MAYSRYLAIGDARRRLSKLASEGIWTQKQPTLHEVAAVFASKSTYFNHNQIFAQVPNFPLLEKWLLNEDDAPVDSVLWGSKKPTYEKLRKLVATKKEKSKDKKEKKGENNSKKGSSSKSRGL